MKSSIQASLKNRKESELIVLPFFEGPKKAKPATDLGDLKKSVNPPISQDDFLGERGETALVYLSGKTEKRCLMIGLGKESDLSVERLRLCYCEVAKFCQKMALSTITVVVPNVVELRTVSADQMLEGVCEGLFLTNYRWEELTTVKEETVLLEKVQFIGILPKKLAQIKRWETVAEGVHFCRDLVNGNADDVTPQELVAASKKIAASFPSVKATIFDKTRIKKEKMGLLMAVSRGSAVDPAFIILRHSGAPKSKEHTVLVGKGVTYDTGGLNLKTAAGMETMREDMAGAACAISTVLTAAALNLKCNVTAVVPATENAISSTSYKMGDVYTGYSGATVEIGNTDAEGRLILADALAYAEKNLKPTRMIDLATLTGSVVVALGDEYAGLFSRDEKLIKELRLAGENTHEQVWPMPLPKSYVKKLKSSVADIRNVGGRAAGSITAALFLDHFVEKTPWAHLDIAGVAFQTAESGYWPKNGVGFGVRLLINLLSS